MTDDLEQLRSHGDWKWYGYPGHFIASRFCTYHLCTRVGNYLVSTLGAYHPPAASDQKMHPIGCGQDDFFETFVFRLEGEESGDPVINYSEIDTERYADSRSAERGHYDFCWKYHALKSEVAEGEI